MSSYRKFLAISAVISGVILIFLGTTSIGFYLYSVMDVLDNADHSAIFWYLIFVLIGIILAGLGIYFIRIGYMSYKDKNYTGLTAYSLVGLAAIIITLIFTGTIREWSADKMRSERLEQEDIHSSIAADRHHIEQVVIDAFDETGFRYSVHISEGAEGRYQLITTVADAQATFLKESEEIGLDSSGKKVIRYVSFEELFERCFGEFQESDMYACIENTGATTFFTLEAQLIPIKAQQQTMINIRNDNRLVSAGKAEFSLDTFTENMKVKIHSFQSLDH